MKRFLIRLVWMGAGALLAALVGLVLLLNSKPDLKIWHTVKFEEEFSTHSSLTTFKEYLALEDRLFSELEDKVKARISPADQIPLNRFHRGSLSDPGQWAVNWNRSFEWFVPDPRAGILLLHGMTDSPYTVRSLGERFSRSGVSVLGLRLPGHGTAPSGLVYVQWEDMAAAVRLGARHLKDQIGDRPLYILGYSNGGALGLHYTLSTFEDESLPRVSRLVLISPQIGITKLAVFAVWQARLGALLRLSKIAWTSVSPEYDPFKYLSFSVNGGVQARRLTLMIQRQLDRLEEEEKLTQIPPILALQSVADSTVLTPAVITRLFDRLPTGDHELVLFGLNATPFIEPLLRRDPRPVVEALLKDRTLPFQLTVISNRYSSRGKVSVYEKAPMEKEEIKETALSPSYWPKGVYSLSHVALPFPPDDPLYGGPEAKPRSGIQLGNAVMRGENDLLAVSPRDLLRLRWNPFYAFLEKKVVSFLSIRSL